MRTLRPAYLAAFALLSFVAAPAVEAGQATAWFEGHNARARVVADDTGLDATGVLRAGFEIALSPGWKTYWRMPGESGVPPNFDWSASENLAEAIVLYPAPARLTDKSGSAVGYKDGVVFPVIVKPKDPTLPVTLAVVVEYGICRDICIPTEAKFSLSLAPQGRGGENATALLEAFLRVPRPVAARLPADPDILAISGSASGAAPSLAIKTQNATDVFVEAPDGLYVPLTLLPPKIDAASGASVFIVDLSKSQDVKDLAGKTLRITAVGPKGAVETTWVAK